MKMFVKREVAVQFCWTGLGGESVEHQSKFVFVDMTSSGRLKFRGTEARLKRPFDDVIILSQPW